MSETLPRADEQSDDAAAGARRADDRRRMLRSAKAVGLITLLSRITGLARDFTQARFLGTGPVADAFRIAFLIPSLLRRLVGEGAMQSGFVPVFSRAARDGDPEALRDFAERFLTLWTLVLLAVTVAGIGLSTALLGLYLSSVSGWDADKAQLAVSLNQWLFAYLVLIGLSALGQGVLNSLKVFALPAATPLFFNLSFIAAGVVFPWFFANDEETAAWAFAAGILAGGVLQCAVLLPSLWRRGFKLRFRWPSGHGGVGEVLRLLLPATLGAGVYQINAMVSNLVASLVPVDGAVSSLYYSGRLVEVVLGVYVFALSTVSLTTLSQQAEAGDRAGFGRTLDEVLRLVCFITIPSTVGLLVLARPIVELILKSGRFDALSVDMTVAALFCHVPGLVFIGVSRVLVSAFYAFKDVRTPVRVALVNLVLNAALCLALYRTPLAHAGVALASTLAVVVQAAVLFRGFSRSRGLIDVRELGRSVARACIASALMAAACWVGLRLVPQVSGRLALAGLVCVEVCGGAAVYFLAARALGASEVEALLGRWWRRR